MKHTYVRAHAPRAYTHTYIPVINVSFCCEELVFSSDFSRDGTRLSRVSLKKRYATSYKSMMVQLRTSSASWCRRNMDQSVSRLSHTSETLEAALGQCYNRRNIPANEQNRF
jgi:hypothetical protein